MGNVQSLDHSGKPALSKSEVERMERRYDEARLEKIMLCYEDYNVVLFFHVDRQKRLGHGEAELALSDFQAIPEVADNPFLPRLFDLADNNCDGYLTSQDLQALLLRLIQLRDPEAKFQCRWETCTTILRVLPSTAWQGHSTSLCLCFNFCGNALVG